MSKHNCIRVTLVAAIFASLTLASSLRFRPQHDSVVSASNLKDHPTTASNPLPDSLASTSTFYAVRRDLRRCAAPRCGGYFVRRVNQRHTRCFDGRRMPECYVAEIDWNGHAQTEFTRLLIRGDLLGLPYRRLGRFGLLRVSEVWEAASDRFPIGDFYRVRDLGIRCITHPCMTHHEAKLNTTVSREIAGVELNGAGASEDRMNEAVRKMRNPEGILVSGSHRQVSGPAGRAQVLQGSQFYLQTGNSVSQKPCFKTGCSRQICADEEVVTTCEFRPEYECYKTAKCERQANGQCGFTRTPQLTRCLNRRIR